MKLQHFASLVASLSFVTAQTDSLSSFITATASGTVSNTFDVASGTAAATAAISSAPAVATSEACLAVSSILAAASQSSAPLNVPADLANECQSSASIVQDDAVRLVDGIMAALEFQSDLKLLINPPEGYLLAGVDLISELQNIRDQVTSGGFTNEFDFERNVSAVLGKAQDGHLQFSFDGLATFTYFRQFALVSLSSDGLETPEIYEYDDYVAYLEGTGPVPLVVAQVDGQDIVEFLQTKSQNVTYGGFQDPDALYNFQLYQLNNNGQSIFGAFRADQSYFGANTTLTYKDGSQATRANYATWHSDYPFNSLVDGASVLNICCNATAKQIYLYGNSSDTSGSDKDLADELYQNYDLTNIKLHNQRLPMHIGEEPTKVVKRQAASSATATQLPGYPLPVVISSDTAFSGYFLDDYPGFEDTAVMVMTIMSEGDPKNFVETMMTFMEECRNSNKTRLVIDVSGNGGGTVAIGYAAFRQLFPDIWPYGAATLRAQEGLDVLGTFYTNYSQEVYHEEPDNITALQNADYYQQYNPTSSLNDSGMHFSSWADFYGPVDTGVDNYTNLIRWDLNDTNYGVAIDGGFAIPGFGNSTELPASPFTSDNIILLSNGLCSSTCTIFSHLIKYQGKVKSIAMGGRPQTTAMQAIGGTKGSQVSYYSPLYGAVTQAHQVASANGDTDTVNAIENSPIVGNILKNGHYIILRGATAGATASSYQDFGFNYQNNIAAEDTSYTPAQFVYEAADCHLWYQVQHYTNVSTLWALSAAQAFGVNNTEVFSMCVNGSTNAPSSLSGNATLYNHGTPTNITDFQPEQFDTNGQTTGSGGSGSGSGSGSGGHHNGVGRLATSSIVVAGAIACAMFML